MDRLFRRRFCGGRAQCDGKRLNQIHLEELFLHVYIVDVLVELWSRSECVVVDQITVEGIEMFQTELVY